MIAAGIRDARHLADDVVDPGRRKEQVGEVNGFLADTLVRNPHLWRVFWKPTSPDYRSTH